MQRSSPRSHLYVIHRLFSSIPRNPLEGWLITSFSRVLPAEWEIRGAVGVMEEGEGIRAMITSSSRIKLTLPLKSQPQSRSSRRRSPATAMCSLLQPRTRRSTRMLHHRCLIINMPVITPHRRPCCPPRMITTTVMAGAAEGPTTPRIGVVEEEEGGTLMWPHPSLPRMWSIRRQ